MLKNWCWSIFWSTLLSLFIAPAASGQTGKLGIITYTELQGWTKTQTQPNVIAFSSVNQATGRFCIITLYGATSGTGNPQNDYAKEWNNLVVQTVSAKGMPATNTVSADGWTATSGGAEVEVQGKALAFLTVISGFGKTVSVLAVFNNQAYMPYVLRFIGGIDLEKPAQVENKPPVVAPPVLDPDGNLLIPEPTRQLTIADLVGEWGDNPGRIATTYVNRSDGTYAGTDSLHFTSTWTIDASGKYSNDFFEVRNGKKFRDVTAGTITVAGRVISLKHKGTAKYVVRGWLELPNMTVLKVAGPWFDDQEIPARIFTDFSENSRFIQTSKWVRKK
jgi:hypothetical protein